MGPEVVANADKHVETEQAMRMCDACVRLDERLERALRSTEQHASTARDQRCLLQDQALLISLVCLEGVERCVTLCCASGAGLGGRVGGSA